MILNCNNPDVQVDWMNLSPNASSYSLGSCLHDAKVVLIQSDFLECTVLIEIDVPYIREYYKLNAELRFQFRLEGIKSLRALTFAHWPGNFHIPKNVSREEESRLVEEYQDKGIEKSLTWENAEELINNCNFIISGGDFAFSEKGDEVALFVNGFEQKNGSHLSLSLAKNKKGIKNSK